MGGVTHVGNLVPLMVGLEAALSRRFERHTRRRNLEPRVRHRLHECSSQSCLSNGAAAATNPQKSDSSLESCGRCGVKAKHSAHGRRARGEELESASGRLLLLRRKLAIAQSSHDFDQRHGGPKWEHKEQASWRRCCREEVGVPRACSAVRPEREATRCNRVVVL